MQEIPAALSIAGSDSGGGAGIQADLKTFAALGVYGTSVVTAVTAQNLDCITDIQNLRPAIVAHQLCAVLSGYPVRAIKTGMLPTTAIITAVSKILSSRPLLPLVIDPVLRSSSGFPLLSAQALRILKQRLFPLATLITPNIPEAESLAGCPITDEKGMAEAASLLYRLFHVPVMLKGGHLLGEAADFYEDGTQQLRFAAARITGVDTHGSGCTLSAAITASLAMGLSLPAAISNAKAFMTRTLQDPLHLSPDRSIINHFPGPEPSR